MSNTTLGEALHAAQERIDALDARVLMIHVIRRDASYLVSHPEVPLNADEQRAYTALIDRRAQGEPVAYLTGEREFYGRPFRVTPAVLIPRPDTELLVDMALERVPRDAAARVLDMGTGSGCVAIAIAAERPRAKVLALDRSTEALAVARRNAVELRVGNVAFLESDWFEALGHERFDVIVSNPPYVASGDPHLTQDDVRFEPRKALEAGADGLDGLRRIIREGLGHLAPGGWLLVEHGYEQADKARSLLLASGYGEIFSARDLAGIERVAGGRLTVAGDGA
jgi:release factor glutamine methyltransferase